MNQTPNDRLLAVFGRISEAEAQNRLMRVADRELALSMMYMQESDMRRLLSLIAPAKAHRVREELALQKHLAVRYDQYRRAITNVIGQLESGGGAQALRSYLRPRSRRRR